MQISEKIQELENMTPLELEDELRKSTEMVADVVFDAAVAGDMTALNEVINYSDPDADKTAAFALIKEKVGLKIAHEMHASDPDRGMSAGLKQALEAMDHDKDWSSQTMRFVTPASAAVGAVVVVGLAAAAYVAYEKYKEWEEIRKKEEAKKRERDKYSNR